MVTSLVWTFVTVYKFALLLQKNRSSFLSQSELSNFFAYIITIIIWNNNIIINIMGMHDAITLMLQLQGSQ